MRSAIVTGFFGYIGNVLTKHLKESGYTVIGIDNDPRCIEPKYRDRKKYVDHFVYSDYTKHSIKILLAEYPDATIFHLAASSLLGPSANNPMLYFDNNTAKTTWLLNTMGPRKFIFASTAAVYAKTDKKSSEYTSKLEPPNVYGMSKLMTEQMLSASCVKMQWHAVSFRFFNVVGADGDVGQLPGTPHIINKLIDCYLDNTPFIINGTDYNTKDGTCIRDYVHVNDIARALIHADTYIGTSTTHPAPGHHQYNLGSGEGYSVKEIVNQFTKQIGPLCNVVNGPIRIGDPAYLVADNEKFQRDLHFQYKHNNLSDMIQSAWEYRNGRK